MEINKTVYNQMLFDVYVQLYMGTIQHCVGALLFSNSVLVTLNDYDDEWRVKKVLIKELNKNVRFILSLILTLFIVLILKCHEFFSFFLVYSSYLYYLC